jgi:F0F1-type ATP synthase membrane subunit b/b'
MRAMQQRVDDATGRPLPSFSEMSSHQRSQSLDNMARQIQVLTAYLQQVRSDVDAQVQSEAVQHLEHRARLDAHANILLRLRLMDRLRWLVLGR